MVLLVIKRFSKKNKEEEMALRLKTSIYITEITASSSPSVWQ